MASGGGESGEGDIGFQIAPMVDVVFVLLLFFMASAGSQVIQKELKINLPSGQGKSEGADVAKTPIVIDIYEDGRVEANNQFYDTPTNKELPQLREMFKGIIDRFGDDNPVVVRPDPQATHERVMDVLNAAAASGIKNLTFS